MAIEGVREGVEQEVREGLLAKFRKGRGEWEPVDNMNADCEAWEEEGEAD